MEVLSLFVMRKRKKSKRMYTPLCIDSPQVYPTLTFSRAKVPSVKPQSSGQFKYQIYPTRSNSKFSLKISSKFESGNLRAAYRLSIDTYEFQIRKDPSGTSQWFYFKIEHLDAGHYNFIISGFHRDNGLHHHNVSPVAYSFNLAAEGKGWFRIGEKIDYWRESQKPKSYSMKFSFTVPKMDTILFAYLYPYTYSQLKKNMATLPKFIVSVIAKTHDGRDIPAIFWDGDLKKSIKLDDIKKPPKGAKFKPMCIIAARLHPGETNSSFAMEGFMKALMNNSALLDNYSFLLIPMVNVDGVVRGYYRPATLGFDMNRVWLKPSPKRHVESSTITRVVDRLAESRKIAFFLDFHGHTGQSNSFVYGVFNDETKMNNHERMFAATMSKLTPLFSKTDSITFYASGLPNCIRVAFQNRYQIPFAYTLEMTFGGSKRVKPYMQMTAADYRTVGEMTAIAMQKMIVENEEIKEGLKELPPEIYPGRVYSPPDLDI